MILLRRLAAAALSLLLVAATAPAVDQAAFDRQAADRIHGHVQFLASDELEGRDTGSRGHAVAAQYVAAQFTSLGLKPGGTGGGWFLQVPFRRASHARPPEVSLIAGGKPRLLSNVDVGLRPSLTEKQRTIEAGLVFVGHGIVEPRLGIDEYAGLDVAGKIVVVLRGSPDGVPPEVAAHLELTKDQVAASKGAIGIAELTFVPGQPDYNPAPAVSRPIVDWVEPSVGGKAGAAGKAGAIRAVMVLSPTLSRQLFAGAPRSLDQLGASADRALRGFALGARLAIRAESAWQDFASPEVIGLLPGGDSRLAQEYVVLMAHLDHLGINPIARPGEDAIYNGALDNAAGVATMIEAARHFVQSGRPPRRSLLFIANTGEELGLLGADYFASHPTVPARQIAAAINLDMPLLTYDFIDIIEFGGDHSTIGRIAAEASRGMDVAVSPDPMPQEQLFVRSDHYRFVQRGIPSVFLMTGYANGGRKAWASYLAFAYHKPNDDLSQAIRWSAGARFAELNYRIARALADADDRPRWYRGDYFGETFAPGEPRAER
ncbi:MAG: M28 family peptidase [Sphingomicrobium sp.]